jgi:hypothetical protein
MNEKLIITPHTRVAALLEDYPELESLLIETVPAFKKLQNPVLRRTIARVTSLSQAAKVGNIETGRLVNLLRKAVGQSFTTEGNDSEVPDTGTVPDWVQNHSIVRVIDTSVLLSREENPLQEVLKGLKELKSEEVLQVNATFYPAPLIDTVKKKNVRCHVISAGSDGYTLYVSKN